MRFVDRTGTDEGVSPVIGVMLMIVVTIIIAAVVSAFAGGFSSGEKKASTTVISCTILYGTGAGDYPDGGLLFTHKSGDQIVLNSTYLVIANGEATRQFTKMIPVSTNGNIIWIIRSGNQFVLPADNDGSSVSDGYLGWTDPDFSLTRTAVSTYRLVDRETGQTVAEGRINV